MIHAAVDQANTIRCLACGYDLRGLPKGKCPECGREFDPNDPLTFRSADEPQSAAFAWTVYWFGIGYPLLVLALSWIGWMTRRPPRFPATATIDLAISLTCFGPVIFAATMGAAISLATSPRQRGGRRRAWLIPLLPLAIWSVSLLAQAPIIGDMLD